jgi:hypothetical protein
MLHKDQSFQHTPNRYLVFVISTIVSLAFLKALLFLPSPFYLLAQILAFAIPAPSLLLR